MIDGSDSGELEVRWLALTLPLPARDEAILLVEALRRLGARTVEREGAEDGADHGAADGARGRVMALFPAPADPDRLAADVVLAVRASTGLGTVTPRWRWLSRDEWVARWGGGHPARRISDRLEVEVGEAGAAGGVVPGGVRVVRLEPSSAFGTAEHPTTRACLRMLDAAVRADDRVLDVGAGSGVLAIAAVVLGAASATAVEADPVACAAARRNAKLNEVADRIDVREMEVRPGWIVEGGPFDAVLANIGADALRPLLPDLAGALAPHGWLLLSGATLRERDELVTAARAPGLQLVAEDDLEGWWTGRLERVFGADRGGS